MSASMPLMGHAGWVRLASWNVNSIRAHGARVLRWVKANQPDVVAPFDEPRLAAATIAGCGCLRDALRYRNRNLTSAPERVAYQRLIDIGLVDVVRSHSAENTPFTWWNRRGDFYETDRGWRLDHALASPAVAGRVSAAYVDRLARAGPGPDHAPIVISLG